MSKDYAWTGKIELTHYGFVVEETKPPRVTFVKEWPKEMDSSMRVISVYADVVDVGSAASKLVRETLTRPDSPADLLGPQDDIVVRLRAESMLYGSMMQGGTARLLEEAARWIQRLRKELEPEVARKDMPDAPDHPLNHFVSLSQSEAEKAEKADVQNGVRSGVINPSDILRTLQNRAWDIRDHQKKEFFAVHTRDEIRMLENAASAIGTLMSQLQAAQEMESELRELMERKDSPTPDSPTPDGSSAGVINAADTMKRLKFMADDMRYRNQTRGKDGVIQSVLEDGATAIGDLMGQIQTLESNIREMDKCIDPFTFSALGVDSQYQTLYEYLSGLAAGPTWVGVEAAAFVAKFTDLRDEHKLSIPHLIDPWNFHTPMVDGGMTPLTGWIEQLSQFNSAEDSATWIQPEAENWLTQLKDCATGFDTTTRKSPIKLGSALREIAIESSHELHITLPEIDLEGIETEMLGVPAEAPEPESETSMEPDVDERGINLAALRTARIAVLGAMRIRDILLTPDDLEHFVEVAVLAYRQHLVEN